jgi:hypothetical protein
MWFFLSSVSIVDYHHFSVPHSSEMAAVTAAVLAVMVAAMVAATAKAAFAVAHCGVSR